MAAERPAPFRSGPRLAIDAISSGWKARRALCAIRISTKRCASRRPPGSPLDFHYIDEAARIAVMDFENEQPLRGFPGGARALAHAVGAMLARVQQTPPFPDFVEYPDIVGRLWRWVCQTGVFAPGVLDPCTERLARFLETYVWDPAQCVSSHNDPVPRNVLFDGQRLWLIDWESAYRNDPLVDVAIALDNFAPAPELEPVLLRAWLGGEPSAELSARLVGARAHPTLLRRRIAQRFGGGGRAVSGPRSCRAELSLRFAARSTMGQSSQGRPSQAYAWQNVSCFVHDRRNAARPR